MESSIPCTLCGKEKTGFVCQECASKSPNEDIIETEFSKAFDILIFEVARSLYILKLLDWLSLKFNK